MRTSILKQISKLLLLVLFPWVSFSQNLVLNGDLELWDNPNTPSSWEVYENIGQATTPVHGGAYSAMHTSAEGTQKLRQDIIGIVEGQNYIITYYYYDNDPQARTRIWSYWLSGDEYLDANAAELRPNVYSYDQDEWVEFTVNLVAPPTADGLRFDVRVYKQDNQWGGSVYYDDISVEAASIHPEPSNYPTGFEAQAAGLSIELSWIDAIGDQLPTAYLVLGSTTSAIDPPVDGTPVEDDADLADGQGALNIPYGEETCAFQNLIPEETYYFAIYPYTNGGSNIDFKTDGTAPTAEATVSDIIVLNQEDFNDTTLGTWSQYSVVGPDQYWYVQEKYGIDNSPQAKMSGYSGGTIENDDWLISPWINHSDIQNPKLEFWTATKYDGSVLVPRISTDYDGVSDPYTATWTDLSASLSPGNWEWTYSGVIDLSPYLLTTQFYIAFQYSSSNSQAATWEVDEILITGEPGVGYAENKFASQLVISPNPSQGRFGITGISSDAKNLIIYSVGGKRLISLNFTNNGIFNLPDFEKGLFVIVVEDEKGNNLKAGKLILF